MSLRAGNKSVSTLEHAGRTAQHLVMDFNQALNRVPWYLSIGKRAKLIAAMDLASKDMRLSAADRMERARTATQLRTIQAKRVNLRGDCGVISPGSRWC